MRDSGLIDQLGSPLGVRDGQLWIEDCSTVAIAARFGTPVYVLSETRLRENCRNIRAAFSSHWPFGAVELLPSLKANYVLALRTILNQEGVGCDVFGSNELHTALRAQVPASQISVNGSAKDAALIAAAVDAGASVTLDSEQEFNLVVSAAERLGKRAQVRLRIRPDHDRLTELSDFFPDMTIRDAAQLYKPGIEPGAALEMGLRAIAHPAVELTGLMTHLGRHSADPEVWAKMAMGFGETTSQLCREWFPWRPRELDIGGGFPAPRDPTHPDRVAAKDIDVYAKAVGASLTSALEQGGLNPKGIALQIEPGRSLFADAGIHLTHVRHVKTQLRPQPRTWVEVDTTEMFLPDLLMEHACFRPVFASHAASPPVQSVQVVGISCNFDLLARDVPAPQVQTGDVVAFLDTGAYQDAAASNFNVLARPGTVLVNGNHARLVKRHETLDDVLARDQPFAEGISL
jgi:diaminopimelate decarboxylase